MQDAALAQSPAPQLRCFAMLEDAAKAYARDLATRPVRPSNRYNRREALSIFGCFYRQDIDDTSPRGRARVLRMMEHALKREAKNRDARAFGYNKNRHERMLDAFKRERMAFEAITDTRWGTA
jgi:hypothetical protein